MIRVQSEPFDPGEEVKAFGAGNTSIGGIVTFTGTVREMTPENEGEAAISSMTLEHYPGMTQKQLEKIEREAQKRWPLEASLIIHRYGKLTPGEPIVFVATASAHRDAAFEACRFLIDWLKTKAPFWKKEDGLEGAKWVEAKEEDDQAADKWEKDD